MENIATLVRVLQIQNLRPSGQVECSKPSRFSRLRLILCEVSNPSVKLNARESREDEAVLRSYSASMKRRDGAKGQTRNAIEDFVTKMLSVATPAMPRR